MDSNNPEFLILAMHLRDRAPKNQHQPKAKKHFADHLCFHVLLIPFTVLAFRAFSSLRTHFWPFTEVLSEIRSEVTRKVGEAAVL
jgi:hypothetical protein